MLKEKCIDFEKKIVPTKDSGQKLIAEKPRENHQIETKK